jgi:hypothetical protein
MHAMRTDFLCYQKWTKVTWFIEQIQFGRAVIPNLTLPGNPGSNLILVTEIGIQFVFPDESRKLPWIQLRGNIFLRQLSVASFAIDHPSRGQTSFPALLLTPGPRKKRQPLLRDVPRKLGATSSSGDAVSFFKGSWRNSFERETTS